MAKCIQKQDQIMKFNIFWLINRPLIIIFGSCFTRVKVKGKDYPFHLMVQDQCIRFVIFHTPPQFYLKFHTFVTNYYLVGKLSTSLNLSSYLVSSRSKSLSISGSDSSCSWVLVRALGLIVKEEFKSVMLGGG